MQTVELKSAPDVKRAIKAGDQLSDRLQREANRILAGKSR